MKKTPTAKVKIGTSHINMMDDSGSTVNIMSYKTYQSIQPVPTLKSAKGEKLLPYATKKEIPIVGKFQCTLESKHCFTTGTVYVTKIDAGSILGFESAVELKVLHIANRIQQTHQSPGAQKILYKWFFSRVLKFANVHCRPGSREFIFAVKYIQLSPKLTTCLN